MASPICRSGFDKTCSGGRVTWPKTSGPVQLGISPWMLPCSGSFHTWGMLKHSSARTTRGYSSLSCQLLTIRLVCATVAVFSPLLCFRLTSGAGTGVSAVRILCGFAEEFALRVKENRPSVSSSIMGYQIVYRPCRCLSLLP